VMPLLFVLVGFEVGVTFFGALIPQVQQQFRVSTGTVALALSAYHAIRLVINVPAGRLIARSPLTRMLAVGGATMAVGAALVGLAPHFWVVLLGRVIMGTGSAVFFITTQFWISKIATPSDKAQLFSYNQIATLTGSALGPAIGGAVAGWLSWRHSLILSVLAGVSGVILGSRLDDPTARPGNAAGQASPPAPGTLRLAAVLGAGMFTMALLFHYGGIVSTLIPLLAARELHLGPGAIGGILMLGTVWRFGAALAGGRLAVWAGTRRVVLANLIILSVTAWSFLLVNTPLDLLIVVSLISCTHVGGSLVVALVTDLVPEAHWGTALGLNRTMADIGAMTAPLLAGFVLDRSGFGIAFGAMSIIMLAITAVAAVLTAREPTHATTR